MSLIWADYLIILGLFLGAGGIGVSIGQYRLSIREIYDAVT